MAGPDRFDFVRLVQMLGGELSDRLQHPVARLDLAAATLDDDQRTVDKRRQQLEAGGRADGQGGLNVEPAEEHRKLAE